MKLILFTACLLAAAAPPAKEPVMKAKSPVLEAAHYKVPAGWTEEFSTNQGDPQAVLSKGLHKIRVRFSGGEGSRYKNAAEFLAGFESRSRGGKLPEKTGLVKVSGSKVLLFRREKAVSLPPPDESGPASFAPEEFCAVPAGKRFFVLSYLYEDSIPDPDYDGLKVWRTFLKGFGIEKAKRPAK